MKCTLRKRCTLGSRFLADWILQSQTYVTWYFLLCYWSELKFGLITSLEVSLMGRTNYQAILPNDESCTRYRSVLVKGPLFCSDNENLVCLEEGTWHKGKYYSAHRLIGSRIIESAACCNQILLVPLYLNIVHKKRRLIESFGYCYHFYAGPKWS